jgi:catechol 2,3-dioxygenase-like lactoylglutathione lyase family enzyme
MAPRASATARRNSQRRPTPSLKLGAQEIVAFVATRDPDRAKMFYRDALGLSLVSEDPFALVFDAHGTMLRVATVPQVAAAAYTVLGWRVPNIVTASRALRNSGVTFERYEGMRQDKRGVWKSPSGARVAWFKDPDGNTLSITQS